MKIQGYKFAVAWIALNDSPADKATAETVAGYVSVALVADIYGKEQDRVAQDVANYREKHTP